MSNRRKLQGRGGNALGGEATAQPAMRQLLAGLQAISDGMRVRADRRAVARRAWCAGKDAAPAGLTRWPEDSLGHRLFSGMLLEEARKAPSLAAATVPDADVIAADPAHWNVAVAVLVRAVLLDGVPADDPAVRALLGILGPVAEAEMAYGQAASGQAASLATGGNGTGWMADEPGFSEQDGPMFLLGTCALIDATWAVIGHDPLHEVLSMLAPLLDDALPGQQGQVIADALVRAFSHHYRCEQPGDEQVLERLVDPGSGDPLEDLVAAGTMTPGDALRLGLAALSTLGELCRSESASVLRVPA